MNTRDRSHRIGQLVQQIMDERAISGRAFAKQSGLNYKTIKEFIDGETIPSKVTRTKLEKALGWELGSIEAQIYGLGPLDSLTDDGMKATETKPRIDVSHLSDDDLIGELVYRFKEARRKITDQ